MTSNNLSKYLVKSKYSKVLQTALYQQNYAVFFFDFQKGRGVRPPKPPLVAPLSPTNRRWHSLETSWEVAVEIWMSCDVTIKLLRHWISMFWSVVTAFQPIEHCIRGASIRCYPTGGCLICRSKATPLFLLGMEMATFFLESYFVAVLFCYGLI